MQEKALQQKVIDKVKEIIHIDGEAGDTDKVFGPPIKEKGHVIIPLAEVMVDLGAERRKAQAKPYGYLLVKEENVTFHPTPVQSTLVQALALLIPIVSVIFGAATLIVLIESIARVKSK
jgi:hypothetical protein